MSGGEPSVGAAEHRKVQPAARTGQHLRSGYYRVIRTCRNRGVRSWSDSDPDVIVLDYQMFEEPPSTVSVAVAGRLEGLGEEGQLLALLGASLAADGVRDIVFDLSGLTGIDLEGVAVLLRVRQESQSNGKRFRAVGAAGTVRDKLSTTGVLKALEAGK